MQEPPQGLTTQSIFLIGTAISYSVRRMIRRLVHMLVKLIHLALPQRVRVEESADLRRLFIVEIILDHFDLNLIGAGQGY